jgi:hypothetical protein
VLDHLQTPEKQRELGDAMFAGAAIAGLLTALGWAIAGRRERAAAVWGQDIGDTEGTGHR